MSAHVCLILYYSESQKKYFPGKEIDKCIEFPLCIHYKDISGIIELCFRFDYEQNLNAVKTTIVDIKKYIRKQSNVPNTTENYPSSTMFSRQEL